MVTDTAVKLGPKAITTSVTTAYTVPSTTGIKSIIKNFEITNTSTNDVLLRVFLVPSAGSSGTGNAMIYDEKIVKDGHLSFNGAEVLEEGDTIEVQADLVGLTLTGGIIEITP